MAFFKWRSAEQGLNMLSMNACVSNREERLNQGSDGFQPQSLPRRGPCETDSQV